MELKNNAKIFFERFSDKKTTTWASSLAYYTALSLAPLLMMFLLVSSLLGYNLTQDFIEQSKEMMGAQAAETIASVIDNAKSRPDLRTISGIVSVITLMVSASLIFGQLREALNFIFDIEIKEEKVPMMQSALHFVKVQLVRMGLVLGFLILIIASLVATALIASNVHVANAQLDFVFNIIISGLIYLGVFTLLFRYIPEIRMPWRDSARGGLITAVLFMIGKELIGIYLGHSALSSTYGAAGSILVLLAWVYYSSLIIFIGAHVCCIFSKYFRKRLSLGSI